MGRFDDSTVAFTGENDLICLAVIAAGMVALAVPVLAPVFLVAVIGGYLLRHQIAATPPAYDDRQDAHDR